MDFNHRDVEPTFSDDSIPYLSMKSCYMSNEKELVDFVLKAADEMSEAQIAILDLRGNFGGDGITSNKFIVLVDSNTGSAAESIVDNLRHLDNTLFIGMQTFGCLNNSSKILKDN